MTDAAAQVTTPHHSGANSDTRFAEATRPTVGDADTTVNPAKAFAAELHQRISRRAYELAEQRGFAPGNEIADWLRAEREVLAAPDVAMRPEHQLVRK